MAYQRKTQPIQPKEPTKPPALFYIADRDKFRVWRENWFGDQFEILTKQEFEALEMVCKRFVFLLTEHVDNN